MPWKCHFLWMWNRAGFLPDIAALGCCDCAWSIHPHWMKLCVSPVLFLPFYLVVCKSKLPTSNVQGIRQSWDRDTGKVGGKQSEELCLWVTLGSKIMSLVWSCCQRHFNVFGQDQEIQSVFMVSQGAWKEASVPVGKQQHLSESEEWGWRR